MPMRNKVKQFIDAKGITAYQFIKETGIAPGTGYKLYKDPKHMPSPVVLEIICDTYEIQPNEILEWSRDGERISTSVEQDNKSTGDVGAQQGRSEAVKSERKTKKQPSGSGLYVVSKEVA